MWVVCGDFGDGDFVFFCVFSGVFLGICCVNVDFDCDFVFVGWIVECCVCENF